MATLDQALRQFESTEANLARLEKLWQKIEKALPSGPTFGAPPGYDEWCIAFERILEKLPAVDGFRVERRVYDYDEAGQMHLDALEIGDFEAQIYVVKTLAEQGKLLREYGFRLRAKRRELVRDRLVLRMNQVDEILGSLRHGESEDRDGSQLARSAWTEVCGALAEIDTLLGSSPRPEQWDVLRKPVDGDAASESMESAGRIWPEARAILAEGLYGEFDPIPVEAKDLGELVDERPSGAVSTGLNWSVLTAESFERLLYQLIAEADAYENVQWLQKTYAPDRGRDLSANRLDVDPLSGVRRHRTIIQCKHWLSKSVGIGDVAAAREAMALWEPPRVDGLVIATSGRFTADAVAMVEKHNQGNHALTIEMWPESHLERLLAGRPHLIGQFSLRDG